MGDIFWEMGVKERVKSVLNYKKPTLWIMIATVAVLVILAVCFLTNPTREYQIRITIPAGSTETFCYSDAEISPKGNTLTFYAGEGLGDTEIRLLPVEVREENAYDAPAYITPGMPVKMDVEKGAWFRVGVNIQNPTDESKDVYISVSNVEVRIASSDEAEDGSLSTGQMPGGVDAASRMEDGTVITEEILEQCREEFDRCARFEGAPSREEMDVLYQRFLDSGLMEREEMRLTGVAAGDYDGNGYTDMVVCLFSLEEDADYYSDGCLYLFMNEDEPCRIYEEFCCYGFGAMLDIFGADVDGDGKTEVVIPIQGMGNGGPGDTCKIIVKYLNPGIRQMELPSNLEEDYDQGIEVTVKGDPKKGVYIAYCAEFDEEIEFSAEREADDMRGGNCRGYCILKMGEYQGEEALLGYEYLYVGSIVECVGDAVFVIKWDEEGTPYVRDWYVEGL